MSASKTVLFVEDDPRDQELALNALSHHDLSVTVVFVDNGEEALDYLYCRGKFERRPEGLPLVVILDMKMPKVDGLEVLRHILSEPMMHLLPVVFLTSSREEGDLRQGYELGANAYVVKPVDFKEFSRKVRHIGLFWTGDNEPPPSPLKRTHP